MLYFKSDINNNNFLAYSLQRRGGTMIIQFKGNVTYPITLDASVWIFDDRKVILEEAFLDNKVEEKDDSLKKAAEMFNQELYFQTKVKPPVNKSINKFEKEKILEHSFVMPFEDFFNHA